MAILLCFTELGAIFLSRLEIPLAENIDLRKTLMRQGVFFLMGSFRACQYSYILGVKNDNPKILT